jgi:hypothetical protein
MRRHRRLVFLAAVLAIPLPALAKFGIVKTKVVLPRFRPPLLQMGGRTVAVEIVSEARGVGRRHESAVRERLEGALRAWGAFELRRPGEDADNVVRVHLDDLEARIESSIEYETRYVKVGTREEWDEKKKKNVLKDVYDNRREPVAIKVVTGRLDAQVELVRDGDPRTAPADVDYHERFKGDVSLPREAETEGALEEHLVEEAALRAVAAVCYSPDPVEALLAVDGDLKPGNRLAETGEWDRAQAEWKRREFKGDKEAARLHNLGVAQEALAYRLPIDSPEHREHLEVAATNYGRARELDRGEKYFEPPLERIRVSLRYAEDAARYTAELRTSRQADPGTPAASRPPEARERAPRPDPLPASKTLSLPVLDGPRAGAWRVEGVIANVVERGRGTVVEIDAQREAVSVSQRLEMELGDAAAAPLRLQYRVLAGDARIHFDVTYADATGRERRSVVEVTAGEEPGRWSEWSHDLVRLRPRPARVSEVRLTVDGGQVRLSDLALAPE